MSSTGFKNISMDDLPEVQFAMEGMGWVYGYGDNTYIPTVYDLYSTVYTLLSDLEESPHSTFFSGGFVVYKNADKTVIDFDIDGSITEDHFKGVNGLDDEE